ncbi:dTDP-4-dehydrorhamnose reductase [Methylobacillus sp.]|uniref:dTDP-4-dehydrorhamnose reductase n=1 Tax=Methylobacillus sp. TaxID=56818 RepID=UPI002FDF1423
MAKFKKILLTGINGQVGHALYPTLHSLGEVVALGRQQLDLSRPDHIREVIQHYKPDLIINTAAYTAVDKAESEPELAYAINSIAPGIFAEEAAKLNALLVHYSTDYVFDGTKATPYVETDETNPLSVYGTSKLAGEKAIQAADTPHLIFRTSWVYGAYGKNFLRTILRLASERPELKIVNDQYGAPTTSTALAETTIAALQSWKQQFSGTYHISNSGCTSWHSFAQAIVTHAHKTPGLVLLSPIEHIIGISTAEYPTPAYRPRNSLLSNHKLAKAFNIEMKSWQDELAETFNQLEIQL